MAAFGVVGPGQGIVELALIAKCYVPHGESATFGQHPTRFRVQARLVGHVHLDVLADRDVERGAGEGQLGDIRAAHGYPVAQPDKPVEPPTGVAVLLCQVDGGQAATETVGDEAGGAADAAARVEYCAVTCDLGQVHELRCGDAAHRVEVLERPEVGGDEAGQIPAGGGQGPPDVPAREAGRILVLNFSGCRIS